MPWQEKHTRRICSAETVYAGGNELPAFGITMGNGHWTRSYLDIPTEIDPDRYGSVVELLSN